MFPDVSNKAAGIGQCFQITFGFITDIQYHLDIFSFRVVLLIGEIYVHVLDS